MKQARGWLRNGLLLLTVIQAATGLWMLFLPRSFYDHVLGVSALPPFNEHLMRDLGGVYLAISVVLGVSAASMERRLVRTALAAYLVVSVSHLIFHATHHGGTTAAEATVLTTSLVLLVLVPSVLLLLSRQLSEAGAHHDS